MIFCDCLLNLAFELNYSILNVPNATRNNPSFLHTPGDFCIDLDAVPAIAKRLPKDIFFTVVSIILDVDHLNCNVFTHETSPKNSVSTGTAIISVCTYFVFDGIRIRRWGCVNKRAGVRA